jgi:hypothetical protein
MHLYAAALETIAIGLVQNSLVVVANVGGKRRGTEYGRELTRIVSAIVNQTLGCRRRRRDQALLLVGLWHR